MVFWDLFGKDGHPVRATISQMGPLLLSRLLALNPTQEGVLNIAFRIADEEGLLLLDLKDLRAILTYISDNAEAYRPPGETSPDNRRRHPAPAPRPREPGGEAFFGEPALEIGDLMRVTSDGRGAVNVLAADRLMRTPQL